MRKFKVTIEVKAPNSVQPDEVAGAINKIIDVGFADAQETNDDKELANEDSQLASSLDIGQPSAVEVK